ncbi:hypothetical protein [Armatimonas sp.]|uniref:hypothetical protein n=1 Tax=Armatimonas sp. TaxID=1872638 RepID=UPI00374CC4FD
MNTNTFVSGWCTACGRRRGNDGRCVNCDPWWTSPLVQVGGPIVAVGSVLLIGLAIALTPPKPDPAVASASSGHSSPPALSPFSAPIPSHNTLSLGPLSPPQFQPSAALAPIPKLPESFFAAPPHPDAAMLENFEQLRYQVRVASNQMRLHNEFGARSEQSPRYQPRTPVMGINSQPLMSPNL